MMTVIEKFQTLTPELQREVEDFIEFLLMKQRQRSASEADDALDWQAASQAALDAIWDNDEDDVYAQLLAQ
ncbi:DUF2281 domain-containing protein [Oscillochloris sp. ZM17-4]|uniref:DUF2281 domain-containing protein n=1 Tax=Oscillochloris sp. ZM17-4 TaxID=2866714 RepID=UPI001C73A96B|nr:DUF2281 domain-containing protein [Oscillochloris sp. ZM17-4]MBX0330068.1 DUF2281 domain-containing protein [Oscillochloris sp. ZM17-4]